MRVADRCRSAAAMGLPAFRALVFFALSGTLLAACGGGADSPSAGAALAERWLRVGEEHQANVAVYEGTVPPTFSDLLNPGATTETPAAGRLALPVHPDGELLGSYLLRRQDGTTLVWLFFDVPAARLTDVTGVVAQQLNESPWQVVGRQGSRSFDIVRFIATSTGDVEGTTIVQPTPASETFEVVVARDGAQQTLNMARHAPAPLLEANLSADLTVLALDAGYARTSGLRTGDRIVRAAGRDVASRRDLAAALDELAAQPTVVSITYLVNIAPSINLDPPPFVRPTGVVLPDNFPMRERLSGLLVEQYHTIQDPTGQSFSASLLSEGTSASVANQVRDALAQEGWEITSDEPLGFATTLEFMNTQTRQRGIAQIDVHPMDEDLTQVLILIQPLPPGGG